MPAGPNGRISLLRIESLDVGYGDYQIIFGANLDVGEGEVVCLLGPNGAGKSTILNATSGLVGRWAGSIAFEGARIDRLPTHQIVRMGIAHVLERRRVFPYMTVFENLELGAYAEPDRRRRRASLERVLEIFPVLADRRTQVAGSLSGGEQQMLAIGRGLMSRPKLLMIDEPFLGLSPRMVDQIVEVVGRLNREGIAILFVEQNIQLALEMSHRGYVLESGRIVVEGPGRDLLQDRRLLAVYLGIE